MATCLKCGSKYLTKECQYCENKNSTRGLVINNKVAVVLIAVILSIIFMLVVTTKSNPLIGEWRSSSAILGNNKVVFRNNSMEMMGISSKVSYDIQDDRVIVTDSMGIGQIINIVDKDTLESNFAGIKTKYKRVK